MAQTTAVLSPHVEALLIKLADDPWTLTHEERHALRNAFAEAQAHWLPIVTAIVEPPKPTHDFPAFLLGTDAFTGVRQAIEAAGTEPDTGTQDLVQHFADQYRDFMTGPVCPLSFDD